MLKSSASFGAEHYCWTRVISGPKSSNAVKHARFTTHTKIRTLISMASILMRTGPPARLWNILAEQSQRIFPDLPAIEPITPGLDHFQTPAIGRANKPMPNDLQIGKWLSGLAGGEAEGEESTKVSETPLPKSQSTEG